MSILIELKQRTHRLQAETSALYLAVRHPRTPWYAKLLAAEIVAYAFSPSISFRISFPFWAISTNSS
jgi:hypothetical protein